MTNPPPFPLGRILATSAALRSLSPAEIVSALRRHGACDWGDLTEPDRRENDSALLEGGRILSAYTAGDGTRFWIITEADRSSTVLLLPEDY